jgi:formylglycine-generating enzyme required for sulfatase activity
VALTVTFATLGCMCGGPEQTTAPQPHAPDEDELAAARTPSPASSAIAEGRALAESMVRVEPGSFTMGTASPTPYPGFPGEDETPHRVTMQHGSLPPAHALPRRRRERV